MTNPRDFQTLWLRLAIPADTYIKKPSGYLAPWNQQCAQAAGAGARYMGPIAQEVVGVQQSSGQGWAPIPNAATHFIGLAQFLSDPLEQQTIAPATWWLTFALRLANAAVGFVCRGRAAIYCIDGRTGERRATIAYWNATSGFVALTGEVAFFSPTTPGLGLEVLAGDYLELEIGAEIENTSGAAVAPQLSVFCDGTDELVAPFQPTTSPKALLRAPVPLRRLLPFPSEQAESTVDLAQARRLCLDAWPPNTPHEFGDPGPGQTRSPDAELMDWFGELFKRFFWDLFDIWRREMDPGLAYLKLSDWRDLFQIVTNPRRRQDLAALVIARLRELSQGTTAFGIASAVGTVLGYLDPTKLEILSLAPAQLRTAVQYVSPLPAQAIPDAAAPAPLRLITPHLYDGGVVWGSGSWMALSFNVVAGKTIHARLISPDGFAVDWSPVTKIHDVQLCILYGVAMAGRPVHGNWTLELYRDVGSPAVNLDGWTLYVPGAPRSLGVGPEVAPALGPPWPLLVPNIVPNAGLGRWKAWWGVYVDPALVSQATAADLREARNALSRIRHAYQRADLILTKVPIPGTVQVAPGSFVPG